MKFFVGSYTRLGGPGIALCELQDENMRLLEVSSELADPSYVILSADQNTLYAASGSSANGEEGGSVAAYDVSDGRLNYVCRQSTLGVSTCHLTLSPDERFLYAASYFTGSIAVFPVSGAHISPRVQLILHEGTGPNAERQEHAHAHFVTFDSKDESLLYAVDLGMDAVMIYRQNRETGLLTLHDRVDVPSGMGPRHLAFHPDGDMMYVAHELGNAVSSFRRTSDGWKLLDTLSTLPDGWEGESYVAAIRVAGNRLFVSNRGHDSLAVYQIALDGSLSPIGVYSTMGRWPRDFVILPDGDVLVAHQESGDLSLLRFEDESAEEMNEVSPTRRIMTKSLNFTGLSRIGAALSLAGAVCVCPVVQPFDR